MAADSEDSCLWKHVEDDSSETTVNKNQSHKVGSQQHSQKGDNQQQPSKDSLPAQRDLVSFGFSRGRGHGCGRLPANSSQEELGRVVEKDRSHDATSSRKSDHSRTHDRSHDATSSCKSDHSRSRDRSCNGAKIGVRDSSQGRDNQEEDWRYYEKNKQQEKWQNDKRSASQGGKKNQKEDIQNIFEWIRPERPPRRGEAADSEDSCLWKHVEDDSSETTVNKNQSHKVGSQQHSQKGDNQQQPSKDSLPAQRDLVSFGFSRGRGHGCGRLPANSSQEELGRVVEKDRSHDATSSRKSDHSRTHDRSHDATSSCKSDHSRSRDRSCNGAKIGVRDSSQGHDNQEEDWRYYEKNKQQEKWQNDKRSASQGGKKNQKEDIQNIFEWIRPERPPRRGEVADSEDSCPWKHVEDDSSETTVNKNQSHKGGNQHQAQKGGNQHQAQKGGNQYQAQKGGNQQHSQKRGNQQHSQKGGNQQHSQKGGNQQQRSKDSLPTQRDLVPFGFGRGRGHGRLLANSSQEELGRVVEKDRSHDATSSRKSDHSRSHDRSHDATSSHKSDHSRSHDRSLDATSSHKCDHSRSRDRSCDGSKGGVRDRSHSGSPHSSQGRDNQEKDWRYHEKTRQEARQREKWQNDKRTASQGEQAQGGKKNQKGDNENILEWIRPERPPRQGEAADSEDSCPWKYAEDDSSETNVNKNQSHKGGNQQHSQKKGNQQHSQKGRNQQNSQKGGNQQHSQKGGNQQNSQKGGDQQQPSKDSLPAQRDPVSFQFDLGHGRGHGRLPANSSHEELGRVVEKDKSHDTTSSRKGDHSRSHDKSHDATSSHKRDHSRSHDRSCDGAKGGVQDRSHSGSRHSSQGRDNQEKDWRYYEKIKQQEKWQNDKRSASQREQAQGGKKKQNKKNQQEDEQKILEQLRRERPPKQGEQPAAEDHSVSKVKATEHANSVEQSEYQKKSEDGKHCETKEENAVEVVKPENAVEDVKPENAVEDAKPENAVEDVKPENAVEDAKPENAVEDVKPENAVEDAKPENTVEDVKPENAVEDAKPENAVEDAKPENAVEDVKPENAVEDAKPENAVEDVKPENAVEDAKPENAVEDVKPENAVEDAKPENAVEDAKPENAVEDVKPENAVEDAKPENAVEDAKPENAVEDVKPENAVEDVKPENAVESPVWSCSLQETLAAAGASMDAKESPPEKCCKTHDVQDTSYRGQDKVVDYILMIIEDSACEDGMGIKLVEVNGDVFSCPPTDAMACCVSEDLVMGKGIAVRFKEAFCSVDDLKAQAKKVGDVAMLYRDGNYVYYLITKKQYFCKPTYQTLKSSLTAMKNHMVEHKVTHLSMPTIGCGLDGLVWDVVADIIRDVFHGTGIQITIYHYNGK